MKVNDAIAARIRLEYDAVRSHFRRARYHAFPLFTVTPMERINLPCSGCGQTLAANAQSAGQQVRCPKCQAINLVPKPNTTPDAKPKPRSGTSGLARTAGPSASESKVVSCGKCQKRLSVRLLDKPSSAICPVCQSTLRLPARQNQPPSPSVRGAATTQPKTARSQSASSAIAAGGSPTPAAASNAAATQPRPTATVAKSPFESSPPTASTTGQAAAVDPFSAADEGAGAFDFGTAGGGFSATPAATPQRRPTNTAGKSNAGFVAWMKSHKTILAVGGVTVLALLASIFSPPTLVWTGMHVLIAAVIIIGLLLPRKHIVDKVLNAFGAQAAGLGAGGVALVVLAFFYKFGMRILRRSQRASSRDWSNAFDSSTVTAMVTAFIVIALVITVTIFLWKRIGIFRTLAYAYLAELSFVSVIVLLGTMAQARHDAGVAQRRAEMEAEMDRMQQQADEQMRRHAQGRAQRSRTMTSPPPGAVRISTTAQPGQVLVGVSHPPGFSTDAITEQLKSLTGAADLETRTIDPGLTHFILDFADEPKALADQITFGNVMYVDPIGRSIRVFAR